MQATYEPLNITAPTELWKALSFRVDGDVARPPATVGASEHMEALAMAFAEQGPDNGPVIVGAAIREMATRTADRRRIAALDRESSAIQALAKAIESDASYSAIQGVLARLNDRTRTDVRNQLGI